MQLAGHAYLTQSFSPERVAFRDQLLQTKIDPNSSLGLFKYRQLGKEPVHEGRLCTDATRYQEHTCKQPPTLRNLRRDPIGRGRSLNSCYPSDLSRRSRVGL